MSETKLAKALRLSARADIVKRSSMVSLVVGTVLNFINQGDVYLEDGTINLWKCALTYLVPYLVATYGSVMSLTTFNND